ncbi:MAG: DUF2442 domain-containing protein [Pseudomonadota bacterium]
MYWDVTEVRPSAPRCLSIRFADGLSGTVFIERDFCTGVFAPLLDDELVAQARVEHGVVVWPNGLDLAPDTMYREVLASPDRRYVVGCHALESAD